jgi:hypothetical protein
MLFLEELRAQAAHSYVRSLSANATPFLPALPGIPEEDRPILPLRPAPDAELPPIVPDPAPFGFVPDSRSCDSLSDCPDEDEIIAEEDYQYDQVTHDDGVATEMQKRLDEYQNKWTIYFGKRFAEDALSRVYDEMSTRSSFSSLTNVTCDTPTAPDLVPEYLGHDDFGTTN